MSGYSTLFLGYPTWWMLVILLSLRWRWLERRVSLVSTYGLHGMLGLAALRLAWLPAD